MRFAIDPERSVAQRVQSIARHEAETAIDLLGRLDEPDADAVDLVHEARKQCKKLRAVARVVRPALGRRYRPTNAIFRDAARELSPYRDAHALLDTFHVLVETSTDRPAPLDLAPVCTELARRAAASTAMVTGHSPPVERSTALLRDGLDLVEAWELDGDGWELLAGGIGTTYGRGVDAVAAALDEPAHERFHELRKRAKYTWHHLQLISGTAPSILEPLAECFHALSDGLGDAHDLAVLADHLQTDPGAFGGDRHVEAVLGLLTARRTDLERRSMRLAARLYVEPADRFVDRLGGYWSVHLATGPEEVVGELGDVIEPT